MDILTSEQLAEWEAYHRLEPIGNERIEFSFAVLASVITNIAIAAFGRKGTKQTSPMDFMPVWDEALRKKQEPKVKKQSIEEMKAILQSIAAVYGKPKKKREVD